MRKKSKISQDDLNAFKDAVQDTKPLRQHKVRLKKSPVILRRKIENIQDESDLFDGGEPRETVQHNDYIEFKRDGVSHKTLRKLNKGQYNVQAVLDLHRHSVEDARTAVNRFLHECVKRRIKTAVIVHGKGKPESTPILKNQINYWLRQAEPVLAFCSAAPRHGGRGAVYVLFKSHVEEKFA